MDLQQKCFVRLRTIFHRGVKIDPVGNKIYPHCDNCPDAEQKAYHILNYPAILAYLQSLLILSSKANLYKDDAA